MCEMSQKRPLIRSTLVLAFERGKEEEEFKEKESKKKINALRLSSIIFVVALVYVVVYVVVNSLIEDIIEKNFAYILFLVFDFSQKNKRGNLSVLEKKRGKLFRKHQQPIQLQKNELFSTIQKQKRRQERKKMNDAAAATFDAVSDGVSDVKDTVGKYVQFNANKTNFFIKLRKNLDVRFPGNYSSFVLCIYMFLLLLFFIKTFCCVHLLCAHD